VNKLRRKATVLLSFTAAAASMLALTMNAMPALAKPSAAGSQPACAASQLSMTVPTSIAGDPANGMGSVAWNIMLSNTSQAPCSLSGWAGVSITAAGQPVAIASQDVQFSNLAQVRPQPIVLTAGQQAVITVQAGDSNPGCRTPWGLTLRLPGQAGALTASQPAGSVGPCGGGTLRLSPFYPRSALATDISELQVAQSPSPYQTTNAPAPASCTAQRMQVTASYGSAVDGAMVDVLHLASRGFGACTLPGEWPTVTLHSADGATQIAKALPGLPSGLTRSPLVAYEGTNPTQTDLTLNSGNPASIALVAQTTGATCHVATTATIYPGLTDAGAGLTIALARPMTFCGLPRVLSFLAGQPAAGSLTVAAHALVSGVTPDGDGPSGFWYGSDSNSPVPTSSSGGVYLMPHSPGGGDYGGYVGELGGYDLWKNCVSGGPNWNQTGYNDAQSNFTNHSVGVGAGGYWMMAGPGREPGGFTTAAADATNWGTSQAERAVSDVGQPVSFPYIFMDIEAADPHGWNKGFSGTCAATETASSISTALDVDTFNGFWNYVEGHSPYLPAVYEAGGSGGSSWSGIFGSSKPLTDTLEWTYTNETSSISTFPTGWSVNGTAPAWYASAPSSCQVMWQWSGGNGQINSVGGDFDQIDGNRTFACK
jgi:hypothetical protein